MSKTLKIVLLVLVAISFCVLGSGITGLVVAKDCCLGAHCNAQNTCSFEQSYTYPQGKVFWGLSLLIFSGLLYMFAFRNLHD